MTTDNEMTDVIVITPEQQIENALVKENVTEKVIAALNEKYGALRLKSLTDQESYLELKSGRRDVRKVGILAEQVCKKGREDAIKTQRLWIAKEKEVLGKIAKVQDPLDLEIKRYEDEQNRLEQIEIRRKEQTYMDRQTKLFIMGAKYADGSIVLRDVSYETTLIREANEDMWESMLAKYNKVYAEIEAAKVEEENRRKAEAEELKKQQDELKRQQQELKDQQDKLRAEQILIENKKYKEREQILQQRRSQLVSLGMVYQMVYDYYAYEDVKVDNAAEILLLSEQEWNELIEGIKPMIEQRKQIIEAERQKKIAADIAFAKEEATRKERERIEQEQRDAEAKRQQEEQRKEDELAQAGDAARWVEFTKRLSLIKMPQAKSSYYKSRVNIAKQKLEEISQL